ncbi:hypothetical protein QR98_0007580 [Sarcoptes scabiei]|uniref:Uncharacterized protein n=1 Tax=Sarcoptes scabiei TaxID=52283 RepID=A0A131ZU62_SARSC|nr:hypothetical protein QR98_0007580 [Sarcoptes scabiei]
MAFVMIPDKDFTPLLIASKVQSEIAETLRSKTNAIEMIISAFVDVREKNVRYIFVPKDIL